MGKVRKMIFDGTFVRKKLTFLNRILDGYVAAGLLLTAALVGSVSPAPAATLAYWRMEGDGVSTPVAGATQVLDTNGRTTTNTTPGIVIVDASGNGNTVWAWDHPGAGHTCQSPVPATAAGHFLQSRTNLIEGVWEDQQVIGPMLIGGKWQFVISAGNENAFFRLQHAH
jgi:hypothetical protein